MAFPKALAHRFVSAARSCASHLRGGAGASSSPLLRRRLFTEQTYDEPTLLRRFLHRRPPISRSAVPPDRIFAASLLAGGDTTLADRIRSTILPPPTSEDRRITVDDAKKVLRAAQMEAARARFRVVASSRSSIAYHEFISICREICGHDQAAGIARSLDESGAVIVFGDVVFLRPDQVVKAVESMIPLSIPCENDPRLQELREMEEVKAVIDKKAEVGVRRELWCGLGFLAVQTAAFMRLTFWELSWDVMEPICFFVTSIYVMAGYTFFLRTSRDPSFEGYFTSRFASKQKRLLKSHKFDVCRFNELRGACSDRLNRHLVSPSKNYSCSPSYCDCSSGTSLMRAPY